MCILRIQTLGIVTTRTVSTFAIVYSLNAKLALIDDLILTETIHTHALQILSVYALILSINNDFHFL